MLLSKEVSSEGEFDPHPKITPLKTSQTFTAQPQPEMLKGHGLNDQNYLASFFSVISGII